MRKLYLALTLVLLFSGVLPALAQQDVTLQTLEVDLWPEYDRPEMLVIYRITLPVDTLFPVELRLRIPLITGDPNAVAEGQSDQLLYDVPFERTELDENWAQIKIVVNAPTIRLEYYDPRLEKDGISRNFTYTWAGGFNINSFILQVQRPVDAEGMVISPALGDGSSKDDGLLYYESEIGTLGFSDTFHLTVEYQKANDVLSVDGRVLQPSTPITEDTAGRMNWQRIAPYVLGVLGVALIGGGLYWYWQSTGTSRRHRPARFKRKTRAPKSEPKQKELGEDGVYCHMCGKRGAKGDRFCRSCGTPLRTE